MKQNGFRVKFIDEDDKREIVSAYRNSSKRLLLLDYDGTLVSYTSDPDEATPGEKLLQIITSLALDTRNDVFLVSGRSSKWLEKYFGLLPVHLIAEHGAKSRYSNKEWVIEPEIRNEWKPGVHYIMETYARKCDSSLIEEKDFSMVWHYRNANPEQARLTALELFGELDQFAGFHNLEVLHGNKIIEVRNKGIDKGSAIKKLIAQKNYDFIFAAGDDKTDEDMFRVLLQIDNSFTIKVGSEPSYARYNLPTPQMIIFFLQELIA
jgi:trehalose 6-phosphate synthase/phosphatase